VDGDASLIISRATAEKATTVLYGLERRRIPKLLAARRLDIVVRIKQDRWRSGRTGGSAEHGWVRPVNLEQPYFA
jgi:hypothetical protein